MREKVDEATPELPGDANTPSISDINFSLQPTILVAVSGDVPERTLDAKRQGTAGRHSAHSQRSLR